MVSWLIRLASIASLAVLLFGCTGFFGAKEKKGLPGERISVLALQSVLQPDPKLADLAVRLPKPFVNANWPQAGGLPDHAMHHLSASGPLVKIWSEDVGEGEGRDGQPIAPPIVVGGRVYTVDVNATVQTTDAATGKRIWRVELAPKDDDEGLLGGGIAYADGRLYVATGFAQVIALDSATGAVIWRRKLSAPVRSSPTIFKGRVFATTITNELSALDTKDGSVLWSHTGISEVAGLLGGASAAAAESTVVAAYSSGEVIALRIENGRVIWSESLTALRRSDPISTLAHVRGRPVINRGQVIVTSNSGRTMAIGLTTGNRQWEQRIGSSSGPWVAGDFVYLLTNANEIVCLARRTGSIRWVAQLQRFEDEEDKEDAIFWSGPVLAGDRLLVGGSHGEIWSISPYSGRLLGRLDIGDPLYIAGVVANDTVYFLTNKAKLVAFR
ncbi:MAG: outer membrane protein assembly factor BamB [Alphaproteobacteria bacterium]|jgi:outer membrane protein assembly factor BamB